MIRGEEKELMAAYFAGGNAKDLSAESIKVILEVIKESANESKVQAKQTASFHP